MRNNDPEELLIIKSHKMKNLIIVTFLIFFSLSVTSQTITDFDGNVYNTITIGSQVWMDRNLRVTHYNNGVKIPKVTNGAIWITLTSGAYNWQNNDSVSNAETYGALYNWYTTNSGNLCPAGWHVPSDNDWTVLTTFLGGLDISGGKLKETGTTHWVTPNTGATNDVGFTALPGGSFGGSDGVFHDFGKFGYWWSATKTSDDWAYVRRLGFMETSVTRSTYLTRGGFSVRCIKDIITAVTYPDHPNELFFYPNPADERIYVKNNNHENAILNIYDLQGNLLLSKQIDSNPVDISGIKKGIYIVKLVSSENVFIEKLIID